MGAPARTLQVETSVPVTPGGGDVLPGGESGDGVATPPEGNFARFSGSRRALTALAPHLIVITIFSTAQVPAVKTWLLDVGTVAFRWPGLDVVDSDGSTISAQTFKFDHLRATGTLLLLSGLLTALYRVSIRGTARAYWENLVKLRWTIVTVASVLGLAFVITISGQTVSLGMALASSGALFALLSPAIGWLGVAITGLDTASNSLFGAMQAAASQQAGLNPVLMASANSTAGVLGKMLAPQNLFVAVAAVGFSVSESQILRKLIGWSVGLLVVTKILIYLQSTPVLDWMVP